MKRRFLIMLLVLISASIACQAVSGGSTPPPQDDNVLFFDDFSNANSGWDRYTDEDGMTDYASDKYRIFVNTDTLEMWANPGKDFTDTRIEVEATKVGGSDNNEFGVICRYQDTENFYEFIVSSDGYYDIGKIESGELVALIEDTMQQSSAIEQGNATNFLRVECIGSTLALYVNGEKLAEVEDSSFATGDVGLIAGTFDEPGTDVHFDNFMVTQP